MTHVIRSAVTGSRDVAPAFVHLKVHSAYSLLEGALPIGKLAKLAEANAFPAIALTDTGNLFGALEFSDKLWGVGVQPIIGLSIAVDFGDAEGSAARGGLASAGANTRVEPAGRIALLAMNETGFANLMKLTSHGFFDPQEHEPPHVAIARIESLSDGLIVLSGGPLGPVDRAVAAGHSDLARQRLQKLGAIFGDRLYVELQRHGLHEEAAAEPQLIDFAYDLELPLVATNEVYFASSSDHEAHDALLCIADGRYVVEDNRRRASPDHYLKSAIEMAELFADLPEAISNTVEIAKRCTYRPVGRKPILPSFVGEAASADERLAAEAAALREAAMAGLDERLRQRPMAPGFTREDYDRRLAYEVDIIARMKFPGYFLIVADFIRWSKANGVAVGPGRGSGAGSLVAYALTITDLDPLRFGLLFERFLNPERVSMPDFDIDFCQENRDRTIRYVQERYGADRVAQIITHGKLQARAVIRDVGRVLQIPYGQVDKLCKLVPNNPANPVTLPQAIEGEPKLQEARDNDPLVARLIEIAIKLEGLYRHASTHAAGMVIGDRPLDELVPLYRDPKSSFPVTQYNWKLVEQAGLVKFDFLGLKTLTVLETAVDLVRRGRGINIDLAGLELDDKPSYELLARADTVGVFQLESTGMRESLKRLKPDRFEDIIAMVALYRPGPMDNIPTYINRKHGEEPIEYPHPLLAPILEETYGVIIYQEQVMQIAQVLAGYSLGEADLLRRAMGKKDKNEMAKQQARFVEGARANNVKERQAVEIFQLVDKFAGYGFNKSHAAAYALISYHTAYLKANFREEFLAASMTLDLSNTDKLAVFAAEAKKSGITILPPCINTSDVKFAVQVTAGGKRAIRYALAACKNIGESAVSSIVVQRATAGPFRTLGDLATRLDPKSMNKRGLETLAKAGAFDALEANRALVHANVDAIAALASRTAADTQAGTSDLFGGGGSAGGPRLDMKAVKGWTPMERLQAEFEAVGFFLSGHPLDQYAHALKKLSVKSYTEFEAATERGATDGRLAGIVISARERKSQKGNKFAFALFSDQSGQFEAVVFSDTLAKSGDLLEPGKPVVLSVDAEREGDTVKMRVRDIQSLAEAASSLQRSLTVVLDARMLAQRKATMADIRALLRPGGKGEIRLLLPFGAVPGVDGGRDVEFVLPGKWDTSPEAQGEICAVPGVVEVLEG